MSLRSRDAQAPCSENIHPPQNPLAHPHHRVLQTFPNPTRQAPTLNATALDPALAAHRAENLAACLELRDMGLQLARAAAARALAAHDQPPTTNPPPTPKPADPDLAFARHASGVRQAVELWEKIVNNTFARRPAPTHAEPPYPDLEDCLDDLEEPPAFSVADQGNLYEAVATLALNHSSHAAIPETLPHAIEQTLTAHPNDHLSANFARICEVFGITPNRHLLQPHLESQLRPPPDHTPKLE